MEDIGLNMLPKRNRLKKKEIEKVFKEGKIFREDFLVLRILKNNLKKTRLGFIVSSKISKKANIRNKIKRRLSELMALKLKKNKKGFDAILTAQPGLEKKDFWEMEEVLNKIFAKINPLRNKDRDLYSSPS